MDRREDRRAGADDDPGVSARDPLTLVPALGVRQPGVEQRDRVAEARPETADRLRGERDLRDEHDRPEPPLERLRSRLQVDLRLATAGRPVEQEAATLGDPREGLLLVRAELGGSRFALQRLAFDRRLLLLAALPPNWRHELE